MDQETLLQKLDELALVTPGELHRRFGVCDGDLLALVVELQREHPLRKRKLGRLYADYLGVSYVDLDTTLIQSKATQLFSQEFARQHGIIPLYEFSDVITVASSHPKDRELLTRIHEATGRFASPVFSFPDEIAESIEITYQSHKVLEQMITQTGIQKLEVNADMVTADQLMLLAGQESIVNFSRGLILLALSERASDIHIEPNERNVRIRYRIDGVLQERFVLDRPLHAPLVTRFKVMANADISEHRRPQDGRIRVDLSAHRALDLRFSSVPTICGEKVVLRILGQAQLRGVPDLSELQFSVVNRKAIDHVIQTPNGIFFVTGPTGSGKTTTLYSILQKINTPDINIMTIEDPVEYRLDGANQVQMNTAIDLDFARALKSFLRQDPDVILIGEIRDAETAKIATQAALTGHLVFATMHTNTALQAITRLTEIGVEPFLVAPSIVGVMAQRLVRKICEHCKERYPAPREVLDKNFIWDGQAEVFFCRGKGCDQCYHTGFLGRLSVHEIFVVTEEVRGLVARNANILEIEASAKRSGFKPMPYDGLKKVLRGLTTIEEIDAISYSQED